MISAITRPFPYLLLPSWWATRNRARRREKGDGARAMVFGVIGLGVMESAGLLVVRPLDPKSDSTVERVIDIRVDDSPEPFVELRRLLNMTMGVPNRLMTRAEELSKAGKHEEAIAEAKKALEINPRAETTMYGLAKLYAAAGDTQWTLEYLSRAIARQPRQWKSEAANDPAFEKLRANAAFQKLIKP